jgi:hypothetical protein
MRRRYRFGKGSFHEIADSLTRWRMLANMPRNLIQLIEFTFVIKKTNSSVDECPNSICRLRSGQFGGLCGNTRVPLLPITVAEKWSELTGEIVVRV